MARNAAAAVDFTPRPDHQGLTEIVVPRVLPDFDLPDPVPLLPPAR